MKPSKPVRSLGPLVQRERDDDDDEEQFKPLEWGLIRRLFTYTRPFARKRNALIVLTIIRSIQIPAITWAMGRIIAGPIAHHELDVLPWAVLAYGWARRSSARCAPRSLCACRACR
jgi:hypothetical protein